MDPIRVVFAALPRLLRDILYQSLLAETDVTLVGEASNLEELKRMVELGQVDVVVLGLSNGELSAADYELFDADARIRVLAIANHGRSTSLYDLRPHRVRLGEASAGDLLKVIREQGRMPPAERGPIIAE